jgi:hypothetical protein
MSLVTAFISLTDKVTRGDGEVREGAEAEFTQTDAFGRDRAAFCRRWLGNADLCELSLAEGAL